ncbi:MAG: hypothetical protein JXR46_10980 [Calditrichaceae bacterium]|nr:hypothetical protein [Calditrichaceae bacterium]MBN2709556.1 hypothetical protein [Calditrichaceae bacterium]RQV96819.1 MAG: hypothetical protein EH224_03385 [Calditrichota bacterium]
MEQVIRMYFIIFILSFSLNAQILSENIKQVRQDSLCAPKELKTWYDLNLKSDISINDIRMAYSFGSEHYKNENYKAAITYFWRVFVNDTTQYARPAIRKLAISYYMLNMLDSALIVCYRGLERYPDISALHHYAGYIQDFRENHQCAIPHYEFLIISDPKNEFYLEKLASLYYKAGNKKAIDLQKQLISLYPDNTEYRRRLILYIDAFGGNPLEAYREAFLNDPDNIIYARDYADAAIEAGDFKSAVAPLTKLIERDSVNIKAIQKRAKCYEELSDYRSAIRDYKQILSIDPLNITVMCYIALNYNSMKEFANAKYWIEKSKSINPNSGLGYMIMGQIYETAVSHCQDSQNRGRKIDDGFVYRLAAQEYKRAMKDDFYKTEAQKRLSFVEPLMDTKEERFMADHDTIVDSCYTSWIK